MKTIKLSLTEKLNLEEQHRFCSDRKKGDRIKAVLLRSEGWTVPMISQALRIHETSVTRHLNDYQQGKLSIDSGGSTSLLNEQQTAECVAHLAQNTLQTTQAIIAYVQTKFGVRYSVPGMNKWLHRNNFSYKKPKGYPYKASQALQGQFISKYNALKRQLAPNEGILFMDSCHPSMATKITHGWIKKGQSKPIATTAGRTRMNLIGAINLSEISRAIIGSYSTVNSDSIVDFLRQTRKHANIAGTIYLVLDQAGYHRSAEVTKEAKQLNIKLQYLPPYSPNLNPIERLWKVMNEQVRNNRFFESSHEFRQSIIDFFSKKLPKISSLLKSRINDEFQNLDYAISG